MDGSSRRGFLGMLGIGAVGGPGFVKETLKQGVPTTGKTLAKNLAVTALDKSKPIKNSDKSKFTYGFQRKAQRLVKEKAELTFIQRHGLSHDTLCRIRNNAHVHLAKLGVPSHIACLRSFSETRKHQLSLDYYVEQGVKRTVLELVQSMEDEQYNDRMSKYKRLCLNHVEKVLFGDSKKNKNWDDQDECMADDGPDDPEGDSGLWR